MAMNVNKCKGLIPEMKAKGFDKTIEQMRLKLKKLKQDYMKCKTNNTKSGAALMRCQYYESITSLFWYLLVDQVLLSLFILQHSILALPVIKQWEVFENFKVIRRCVYITCTCFTLQVLMKYWHPMSDVVLWDVNFKTINNAWLFGAIHTSAWVVIYAGSVVMDPAELMGVKQYYCLRNFGDPTEYKSRELNRLLSRVRHPSFIGFCVIFWIIPTMSLDRLLLAMTSYMGIAWNVDDQDYNYQTLQHRKKFCELSHVN